MEESYNTLVYNLLYLLQYRIKRLYTDDTVNERNYKKVLHRTYLKARHMERDKFIPPKFSEAMKDLAGLLFDNGESVSRSPDKRLNPAQARDRSVNSVRDNSTEKNLQSMTSDYQNQRLAEPAVYDSYRQKMKSQGMNRPKVNRGSIGLGGDPYSALGNRAANDCAQSVIISEPITEKIAKKSFAMTTNDIRSSNVKKTKRKRSSSRQSSNSDKPFVKGQSHQEYLQNSSLGQILRQPSRSREIRKRYLQNTREIDPTPDPLNTNSVLIPQDSPRDGS